MFLTWAVVRICSSPCFCEHMRERKKCWLSATECYLRNCVISTQTAPNHSWERPQWPKNCVSKRRSIMHLISLYLNLYLVFSGQYLHFSVVSISATPCFDIYLPFIVSISVGYSVICYIIIFVFSISFFYISELYYLFLHAVV